MAYIFAANDKVWLIHNKHHREDGPAIEHDNGSREWYIHGKRHRLDGPAIVDPDGYRAWYANGKRHREDGPAIEYVGGNHEWYIHDKLHRVGGPAIDYVNGRRQWFFEGYEITQEMHDKIMKRIERENHRRKWFILDRLLPKLCSPHSPAFMNRFHADWAEASEMV